MKILVIADDFTGAAEIAGIGWRFGLPTQLLRGERARPADGLTVIDTDTRLLGDADAADRLSLILENSSKFNLVFKKIDSVLRGPVRSEVHAALRATKLWRAALVPQNPSRARIIRQGIYFVDDKPLEQTEFANDPHHPAKTSNVRERIGLCFHDESIEIHDAFTLEEVEAIAKKLSGDELPVGGADFFCAVLRHRIGNPPPPPAFQFGAGGKLFVCGTTSRQRESLLKNAVRQNFALCPITDNTAVDEEFLQATAGLENNRNALLYYDGPIRATTPRAERIGKRFSSAVQNILSRGHVKQLLIEGGATAAGVCESLKLKSFEVACEISQGIVALRFRHRDETVEKIVQQEEKLQKAFEATNTQPPIIIVKPGSYAWPCEVFD